MEVEQGIDEEVSDHFVITTLIMNGDSVAFHLQYDHMMKKINIVFDGIGISIRGDVLCDIEIIDKFGKILDHFGIQDGDTKYLSRNHILIKELYHMLIDKFRESF